QARTPGARVRGAAVAAAAAVAHAELAAAAAFAAGVHAFDQFVATVVEPVGAADRGRFDATPGGLALAVFAEVVIRVQLVPELAHAQLDHDRVVEVTQHLHVIGDHVLGV